MPQVEGLGKPVANVRLELVEFGFGAGRDALEEVLGAGDHDALEGCGGGGENGVEDILWAELVVVSGDEELGLGAGREEGVGVVASGSADGEAEADEGGDAGVAATGSHGYVGSEGEASEEDWLGEGAVEPSESGANVFDFASALVVDALAEARSAEVEAEDREAEGGEGLHGVVDDLGVHGAAGGGMGVGDKGGVGWIRDAGVEQGFEAACRALQVGDGLEVGLEGHRDSVRVVSGQW